MLTQIVERRIFGLCQFSHIPVEAIIDSGLGACVSACGIGHISKRPVVFDIVSTGGLLMTEASRAEALAEIAGAAPACRLDADVMF